MAISYAPIDSDTRVHIETNDSEPLTSYMALESRTHEVPANFRQRVYDLVDEKLSEQGLSSETDPHLDHKSGIEFFKRQGQTSFGEWNNLSMRRAAADIIKERREELAQELADMRKNKGFKGSVAPVPPAPFGSKITPNQKPGGQKTTQPPVKNPLTAETAHSDIIAVLRSGTFREAVPMSKALAIADTLSVTLAHDHPTRPMDNTSLATLLRQAVRTALPMTNDSENPLVDRVVAALKVKLEQRYNVLGSGVPTPPRP